MESSRYHALGDVLSWHTERNPTRPALVFQGRQLSFAEFSALADTVATDLAARDTGRGDRVCILGKNSVLFLAALFGAARVGAVFTPINWRLAPKEVEFILNDSQAKLLFVDREFAGLIDTVTPAFLKHIIVIDDGVDASLAGTSGATSRAAPCAAAGRDDVVMQMYTSGTTGRPKGAMLTHGNLLKMCDLEGDPTPPWFRNRPEDVNLVAMPMFHIGGLECALRPIFSGGLIILQREFDPARVLADIEMFRVTVAALVPSALQMVIEHRNAREADLSSLKTVFYGASPIPLELLKSALRLMSCGFVQAYGMTEATGTIVTLPPQDHDVNGTPRMRSAGKALPGVEMKIVSPDGRSLPPHQVGEVLVRAKSVMRGYWNLPDATAATIDSEGWLHSGDAGYLDEDGYLYIHDRVKDMIVSGGENVYPAEVESAIFGHPQVAEVAVIGIPDRRWGETVMAIVVPRPGAEIDKDELRVWIGERIAAFKRPRIIEFSPALPRNAAGKVLKTELRKPYWEGRDRAVN